jgi:hypothetical protein
MACLFYAARFELRHHTNRFLTNVRLCSRSNIAYELIICSAHRGAAERKKRGGSEATPLPTPSTASQSTYFGRTHGISACEPGTRTLWPYPPSSQKPALGSHLMPNPYMRHPNSFTTAQQTAVEGEAA